MSVFDKNSVENAMYKISEEILNKAEIEMKLFDEIVENDKTNHLNNTKQITNNNLSSINKEQQNCCVFL